MKKDVSVLWYEEVMGVRPNESPFEPASPLKRHNPPVCGSSPISGSQTSARLPVLLVSLLASDFAFC